MLSHALEPVRCHENGKPDDRYSLNLEWTGHKSPVLVLRFCDCLLGFPKDHIAAKRLASNHYKAIFGGIA